MGEVDVPIDIGELFNAPSSPAPGLSGLTRRYTLSVDWGDGVVPDISHLSMLQRATTTADAMPDGLDDLDPQRPRFAAHVTLGRIASHDTDFSRWIERVMPALQAQPVQPERRDVTLAFSPLQAMGQPFRIMLFGAWPFDYRIEPHFDEGGVTLIEKLTLAVADWRHMGRDAG